MLGTQKAELFM